MTLEKLLSHLTGRRFHYQVEVTYYPHPGNMDVYAVRRITVWGDDRSGMFAGRTIRKVIGDSFVKTLPRTILQNGQLNITNISYLGWFKPPNPNRTY